MQNLLDDVATVLERLQALLTWQDPVATGACLVVLSVVAALVSVLGWRTVLSFALCFVVRPPRFRTPTPPAPASFFARLPSRADRIV